MGLLLHIYFATDWNLILDSGFYVFKGLIYLRNKGEFYCATIKDRIYWPYMVPGKDMEDTFGEV